MVGRCIPYWNSPFLGDMLVFGGVMILFKIVHPMILCIALESFGIFPEFFMFWRHLFILRVDSQLPYTALKINMQHDNEGLV